jgi:hypothetical protein
MRTLHWLPASFPVAAYWPAVRCHVAALWGRAALRSPAPEGIKQFVTVQNEWTLKPLMSKQLNHLVQHSDSIARTVQSRLIDHPHLVGVVVAIFVLFLITLGPKQRKEQRTRLCAHNSTV